MATPRTRANPTVLFIVSGAFLVLGVFVGSVPMSGGTWYFWTSFPGYVLLAIALFLLSRSVSHQLASTALVVSAIGWLLVAVTGLAAVPLLGTLGSLIAAIGGIIAAILVLQNRLLPWRSSIAFLVAMIIGGLHLVGLFSLTTFALGVALIVTGILLRRRR